MIVEHMDSTIKKSKTHLAIPRPSQSTNLQRTSRDTSLLANVYQSIFIYLLAILNQIIACRLQTLDEIVKGLMDDDNC